MTIATTLEIPLDTQDIGARLSILLAGKYLVLRLIGIGGMASVYLVRHRIHYGLFAVKVLHPALAGQPELLDRFRREGLLCARLAGHPNIAPVLDVGEGDGLHYLLMPYIRGEDLDHLLVRTGPFSFDDAMLAAIQVNDALLYAWSNGILHGDLTPGNIRLNEFGQFILVDFGLASAGLSPRNPVLSLSTTPRPGTPLYMSPERILCDRIDIRSDLYALGAILYELLTGQAAFRGDTLAQIERNHLAQSRSLAHPVLAGHPGIQPLLHSLLALSPAERFVDPLQLQQALRTLTNYPPPPTVRPQTDPAPETNPPRRRLFFR
jgi:eukaryotic-like serine/threonine-protein kinase